MPYKIILQRTTKLDPTPENTRVKEWRKRCKECGQIHTKSWVKQIKKTNFAKKCSMCGSYK